MRLLMISNQVSSEGHAGFRDTYTRMVNVGELKSFQYLTPMATARREGHEASLAELMRAGEAGRPDVILVATPYGFNHEPTWVRTFLRRCGDPVVLCWEGDPWHKWAKPINSSMKGWLVASDIVFTHAREPHLSLFRRAGARDIRFTPPTYCHLMFGDAEQTDPLHGVDPFYDVVVIGSRLSHWGGISRIPGAASRAKMVRGFQRLPDLRVAVYGSGWSGRGAKGLLPFSEQTGAIREGLVSSNWDHFPRHEDYASNRLPISMIAGRVHVTTEHPGSDWMPGEEAGVFTEATVSAIRERVRELIATPIEDVLSLGKNAHKWARGRLSNRESARFLLAALDKRLLTGLPDDPWLRLADEWPN